MEERNDGAETFFWVNSVSPHAQNVAKAKYEFLFGKPEEEGSSESDSWGSYRPLSEEKRNSSDFPGYETVDSNKEMVSEVSETFTKDTETISKQSCFSKKDCDGTLSPGIDSKHVSEEAMFSKEMATSADTTGDQDLQPLAMVAAEEKGMETSELEKATEVPAALTVIISGVEKEDKVSVCSAHQVEKEPHLFAKEVWEYKEMAFLSQEQPAEILPPAEVTVIEKSAMPTKSEPHKEAGDRIKNAFEESKKPKEELSVVQRAVTVDKDATLVSLIGNNEPVEITAEGVKATEKGFSSESLTPIIQVEAGDDEVFVKETKAHDLASMTEMARVKALEIQDGTEDDLERRHSEDNTDVFSSQFEDILESHQCRGTMYCSMDSLEALSSANEAESYFMFDSPLTPMIQQRIKEGNQLLESVLAAGQQAVLKVAIDSKSAAGALLTSDFPETKRTRPLSYSKSEHILDRTALSPVNGLHDDIHTIKEVTKQKPTSHSNAGLNEALSDSDSEMGSTEQLEKGSTDTLSNGTRTDLEAARRLARRLYGLEGFRRSDVAKHLGKNNDFSKLVAEEYLRFFDFTRMALDQSLRRFLKAFALMGETQERERVLIHFSNRYYACNPSTIPSQDGVHCLTCALMLLNTDLHGQNIGKKMTCQEFITNLDGMNEGKDFPKDLLKALYNSIKNEKLEWTIDEEELKKSLSELADEKVDTSQLKGISRIGSSSNPFLDIPQDPNAAVYKTGFIARKIHADMDGKKTPRGKRGWKTFYAVLKGTILYLQKC
ncbi:PH and SEC7 domain-containing protein 3 isoform X3 [Latimeria chalumnae]|uniref:PH and SEC7 domain-containing protein 3 isoform X3 n=1 Tax=Latimeria chalumnae TaxID=7897 RepID=UPI00313C357A